MLTQTKRDVHITRFHFVWSSRLPHTDPASFQGFLRHEWKTLFVWLFLYDFSMGDAKENHQRAFHWIEQILLSLEVHLQTLIWSGVVSALSLNWTKWGSGILTAQDPRLQLYSLCHLWSKILSLIDLPLGNWSCEHFTITQTLPLTFLDSCCELLTFVVPFFTCFKSQSLQLLQWS